MRAGRYRHYKGGEYIVLGAGAHTETGERLVAYHRAGESPHELHFRPEAMFRGRVHVDGAERPRFERLNA